MSTSKAIFVGIFFTAQFVFLCSVFALALKADFIKLMLLFLNFIAAKSHVIKCKKSEKINYGLGLKKKLAEMGQIWKIF